MQESTAPWPDTAGHHLVRGVATATADETVEAVLQRMRGRSYDSLEQLHVVDAAGRLVGVVPFTRLIAAAADARVADRMGGEPRAVGPDIDQEHLLSWTRQHGVAAPPVVDAEGRLLGCVPPQALIEIARHEHAEDISRLAGVLHQGDHWAGALEAPPWRRAAHRLPWLLVGLAGSAVATMVMVRFEEALSLQIAVAFFIPAIVYLADAVGTQTEAVVVRGLSFMHAPRFSRLLAGEVSAGLIIGATLGAIALPLVYLGFGDIRLAVSVALSVCVAGSLATTCGLIFPWALSRLGLDPAFGSGPVATVVQDVLSLLTYLLVAQLVMNA
jgi:magnesium transporter